MKLNLLHILWAFLLCWGGLGLDNIFFESDALSKLCSVYHTIVYNAKTGVELEALRATYNDLPKDFFSSVF